MADKAISELVSAEQITATDMFVLEQNGTAKRENFRNIFKKIEIHR